MDYILTAGGGFLVGVIVSCILLAKKNLAIAQSLTDNAVDAAKTNFMSAKETYKNMVDYEEARLNGEITETSEEDESLSDLEGEDENE